VCVCESVCVCRGCNWARKDARIIEWIWTNRVLRADETEKHAGMRDMHRWDSSVLPSYERKKLYAWSWARTRVCVCVCVCLPLVFYFWKLVENVQIGVPAYLDAFAQILIAFATGCHGGTFCSPPSVYICDRYINDHFTYDHYTYDHYIYDHYIYDHFTYDHYIHNHYTYDHYIHTIILHTIILHTIILHTIIKHTISLRTIILHTVILHTIITVVTRDQCAPWFFMNCLSALRGVCAPLSIGKVCHCAPPIAQQLRCAELSQGHCADPIAQTPSSLHGFELQVPALRGYLRYLSIAQPTMS